MQSQGDIQGVINALTHLNIIDPNEKEKILWQFCI